MSACMVLAKLASRSSDVIGRHGRVKLQVCVPQSTELAALEGLTPPDHLSRAVHLTVVLLEGAVEGGKQHTRECEQ